MSNYARKSLRSDAFTPFCPPLERREISAAVNKITKPLAFFCARVYNIYNMYKILRIICCVIAALCVAACVFVFIYAGIIWGFCTLLGAVVFFALTVLFKRYQEDTEGREDKPSAQTDDEEPKDD